MTVPPPDCIKLFKNLLEVKVLHVPFEDSRLLVCLAEASAEREGGKKKKTLSFGTRKSFHLCLESQMNSCSLHHSGTFSV